MKQINKFWILLQYVSFVIIAALLVLIWQNEVIGIFLFAILAWLFIPFIFIAVISFICSMKCRTKHQRLLLVGHLINILILFLFLLIEFPNNRCDAYIMEKNYEKNKERMKDLYFHVYNDMMAGCRLSVELKKGKVSKLHIAPPHKNVLDYHWNPKDTQIDSLLQYVGLDRNELEYIQKQLSDIDCISLEMSTCPDYPFTIGFRSVVLGVYSYRIYPTSLSSNEMKEIRESCTCILYSPNVVFEYGGGAIGPQCFLGKEQYMERKASNHD